jgi:hypothetical protein
MREFLVRLFSFSTLLMVSVIALLAHAERLPHPPGPAYGGFMPDSWTPPGSEAVDAGCN